MLSVPRIRKSVGLSRKSLATSPLNNSISAALIGDPSTSPHRGSKRSHSEDYAIAEKPKSSEESRDEKGSQRVDGIDRLDFTSVGRALSCLHLVFEFLLIDQPLPVFRHEAPFGACVPAFLLASK